MQLICYFIDPTESNQFRFIHFGLKFFYFFLNNNNLTNSLLQVNNPDEMSRTTYNLSTKKYLQRFKIGEVMEYWLATLYVDFFFFFLPRRMELYMLIYHWKVTLDVQPMATCLG